VEPIAEHIFMLTVIQSGMTSCGIFGYTVRDNFVVATADVADPVKGLVKKYSIVRMPLFDEHSSSEADALSSVWFPEKPLIEGLESLLVTGNAIITLPLKSSAPKVRNSRKKSFHTRCNIYCMLHNMPSSIHNFRVYLCSTIVSLHCL
jgi:hypothetical protein